MRLIHVPVFQAETIGDRTNICNPVKIVDSFIINADKILSICYGKYNGMDLCTVRVSRDISFYVNLNIAELTKRIESDMSLSQTLKMIELDKDHG